MFIIDHWSAAAVRWSGIAVSPLLATSGMRSLFLEADKPWM
jgi:hypothetical protein